MSTLRNESVMTFIEKRDFLNQCLQQNILTIDEFRLLANGMDRWGNTPNKTYDEFAQEILDVLKGFSLRFSKESINEQLP